MKLTFLKGFIKFVQELNKIFSKNGPIKVELTLELCNLLKNGPIKVELTLELNNLFQKGPIKV